MSLLLRSGGGFKPTAISDLTLWYDYADASTITEAGNQVSQVDNKSGINNSIQSTGANQPIYGTTTLNGLNTMYFDGSKFMVTENNVVIDSNITVFIVLNNSNTLGANANFFRGVNDIGAVTYINTVAGNKYAMFNGSVLLSSTSAVNDTSVLTSVFNGVNSELRRNGTQIASGSTGFGSTTRQLQIANLLTDSEYGEFIYYNRVLTNQEITQVENYLLNKWGL